MRLRPIAIAAALAALMAVPIGASAIVAGTHTGDGAEVVVDDDGNVTSVTVDGEFGFAWDVETSDAEIEFLFITDTEDAAYAVSLEQDGDDVTVNVKPKDWDDDKIQQILDDDGDDGEDGEDKAQVCHDGRTLEIGADGVADHTGHGDTEGACPDDGGDDGDGDGANGRALGHDRDPEAPAGQHGRDNAEASGGNAHGRDGAPGRQDKD